MVVTSIAQTRLRHRLERLGIVERVQVGAVPALKLAFGRADRVTVRMRDSTTGPGEVGDLLAQTRQTDRLDASVSALRLGPLTLRDVRLGKRGPQLAGRGSVSQADLAAALPPGFTVAPVASADGVLVFVATARLFGRPVSARAFVRARGGRVLVAPDIPFGDVLSLSVFSDPRVYVQDVGARPARYGFTLTARARLRGG